MTPNSKYLADESQGELKQRCIVKTVTICEHHCVSAQCMSVNWRSTFLSAMRALENNLLILCQISMRPLKEKHVSASHLRSYLARQSCKSLTKLTICMTVSIKLISTLTIHCYVFIYNTMKQNYIVYANIQ